MRVRTTLHSDSFAPIYLQRHGRVYESYNCRAFFENNVNNWNIFENFTKNFWRPAANIDLYTFKIRSVQKQFHCQQFPHVKEFLLTEKEWPKPQEMLCRTDWMDIDNIQNCDGKDKFWRNERSHYSAFWFFHSNLSAKTWRVYVSYNCRAFTGNN